MALPSKLRKGRYRVVLTANEGVAGPPAPNASAFSGREPTPAGSAAPDSVRRTMPVQLNWRVLAIGLAIAAIVFLATAVVTRGGGGDSESLLAPTAVEEPANITSIPTLAPALPLPDQDDQP